MSKEFKAKTNTASVIFMVAYAVNMLLLLMTKQFLSLMIVAFFGIFLYGFFLGCRPYKYSVDKKTITIYYKLLKNKEVNLMECETICDPVSRWSDLVTRPHAIEIYTDVKKRYCFFPVDRVNFVGAILQGNKRIHCTVKDYTDVHRQLEKKLRKEKRKAEKAAARKQQTESE